MQLTEEQRCVIEQILRFDKQISRLGGYAGTGKTTVVKHLHHALPNFAICAFTGKAANVLRKKGVPATTIHSLIYVPIKDEFGNLVLDLNGCPIFELAKSLFCEGIIIDEASMVSKEIYIDLCSFNIPLIFVGDHGQLEPVGEGINLMHDPDFRLEKIHRNAGEIAHFAEYIRKGFRPASFNNGSKVKFISRYDIDDHLTDVEQIICAYNKTRVQINQKVRTKLGFSGTFPVVGERVMCLRNDKYAGVFNGMQGEVVRTFEKPKNKMVFHSDNMDFEVLFNPTQFNREKYDFGHGKDEPHPFDFAYCITAHKAQGDEWPRVMVIEQKCKLWDHKRWAYTAASRAKEQVVWAET